MKRHGLVLHSQDAVHAPGFVGEGVGASADALGIAAEFALGLGEFGHLDTGYWRSESVVHAVNFIDCDVRRGAVEVVGGEKRLAHDVSPFWLVTHVTIRAMIGQESQKVARGSMVSTFRQPDP